VARDTQPWLHWGLFGLFITGMPQLMSGAMKEYASPMFWYKMEILLVAVIFMFTVRRMVAFADQDRVGGFWTKAVGLISIVLWISVAVPARLIGLF
jgi:hypothetical protein